MVNNNHVHDLKTEPWLKQLDVSRTKKNGKKERKKKKVKMRN
jgi:hypothetical protein